MTGASGTRHNELQVCVARSRRTNRVGLDAGGGMGASALMEFSGDGFGQDWLIVREPAASRWSEQRSGAGRRAEREAQVRDRETMRRLKIDNWQ